MIKELISKIRVKCASLYVGLVLNIFLGIIVGVTVYALMQLVSDSYIRLNYATDARREAREEQQITELREFVVKNELVAEDIVKVAEWAGEKRYLYLMLYSGDRLIYTSDLGLIPTEGKIPESSDTVFNSGFTVDYPTNATLRRYASESARVEISFGEQVIHASVYDYSEYMQYDLMNILSMVSAFIALAFIIINYFRRIVKRIRRLEAEVTIVTHSSMEHKIASKGQDEIGRLSANIDNMRKAILENLNREREARDANTELITAMSHDIRTPLTILLGYLEMMKGEATEQPVLREYIETSERTALRLKSLSDDMFKYSLAFGNSLDNLMLEPYDVGMLFEQMLSEHVMLLGENGYNVEVDYELDKLPMGTVVTTEPQSLMRIFDNVFSNVRKYADIEKPVCITAKGIEGSRIIFECRNTVRTDTFKAESNKIGLKTCARLAEKIAERFEYGVDGEYFAARLYMKVETIVPDGATEQNAESTAPEGKRGGIVGVALAVRDWFARGFSMVKSAIIGKRAARAKSISMDSKPVPSLKPIGYAPAAQDNTDTAHPEQISASSRGAFDAHSDKDSGRLAADSGKATDCLVNETGVNGGSANESRVVLADGSANDGARSSANESQVGLADGSANDRATSFANESQVGLVAENTSAEAAGSDSESRADICLAADGADLRDADERRAADSRQSGSGCENSKAEAEISVSEIGSEPEHTTDDGAFAEENPAAACDGEKRSSEKTEISADD